MPRLFLFFNHEITPRQLARARLELGVAEVAQPPAELSRRWANVPPDEERLLPWMRPVFAWLDEQAAPGDFVLVQGEFGACYLLVRHALDRGLVPVYSTTERHARERDGQHQFDVMRADLKRGVAERLEQPDLLALGIDPAADHHVEQESRNA